MPTETTNKKETTFLPLFTLPWMVHPKTPRAPISGMISLSKTKNNKTTQHQQEVTSDVDIWGLSNTDDLYRLVKLTGPVIRII